MMSPQNPLNESNAHSVYAITELLADFSRDPMFNVNSQGRFEERQLAIDTAQSVMKNRSSAEAWFVRPKTIKIEGKDFYMAGIEVDSAFRAVYVEKVSVNPKKAEQSTSQSTVYCQDLGGSLALGTNTDD